MTDEAERPETRPDPSGADRRLAEAPDPVRLEREDPVRLEREDPVRLEREEPVRLEREEPVRLEREEPPLRLTRAEPIEQAVRAGDPDPDRSPRGWSGLHQDAITIDAARAGSLSEDDVRIHPEALLAQASAAELAGNRQLAGVLRLAAELTVLRERELLNVYELLRPGRASLDAMQEAVRLLDGLGLPAAAALVREASAWYVTRGLVG